ncbi:hypothetical protein [Janthinobacterium fluminis]|uniref:DUF4488 domain-containing protein n=1 Tax=Janthinobacterium fluminis TaxID=2987524 RepID=A0ABT5JUT5_9BURK|nr:hypothetical protein [Janthinobacterium fluminis]MDC8756394.1 hypothetical protein [Janthinobacterium fluminis]
MRLFSPAQGILILCAALLSACGVSVEQGAGDKVAIPAEVAGKWQVQVKDSADKAMQIAAAGDTMSLQWSGAGKDDLPGTAFLYQFRGKEYVLIDNGEKAGGYTPLQVSSRSASDIKLRALDPKRVALRLKKMKSPVTYRKQWLRQEIYLEAGMFEKLLTLHEEAIFQKEIAIHMQKLPE